MSQLRRQGDKGHFVPYNGTTEQLYIMMGSFYSLGFHSLPTSLSHVSLPHPTHPPPLTVHTIQYSTLQEEYD